MTAVVRKLSVLSASLVVASACSLKNPESATMRFNLPQPPGSQAASAPLAMALSSPAFHASLVGLPDPVAPTDFNCFGVNISGDGIAPNALVPTCDSADMPGAGMLGGFAPIGNGFVEVADVPIGTARTVQLFVVQSKIGCSPLSNSLVAELGGFDIGIPYEVGRTVTDVSGDMDVPIDASWDPNNKKRIFCPAGLGVPRKLAISAPASVDTANCSPVTIQVQDAQGMAVALRSDLSVALADNAGGTFHSGSGCTGTVASTVILSGSSSRQVYYKGNTAANHGLSASASGVDAAAASVSVGLPAPDHLLISGVVPASAGQCVALTVTTLDRFNTASNVLASANLVATSTTGGDLFAGGSCAGSAAGSLAMVVASGQSSVSFSFRSMSPGSYSVNVSDSASALLADSKAINVSAGGASSLALVTGFPTGMSAGSALPSFSVQVRDAFGNVVTSAGDTVSVAAYQDASCSVAAGALSGGSTSATAVSGVASFGALTYTQAGSLYVKASSGVLTAACSGLVTVSPGAPASTSTITASPASAAADGVATVSLQATLRDSFGNVLPGQSVSFAVQSGNAVTFSQPGSVTDAAGVATGSASSAVAGSRVIALATPSGLPSVTASISFVSGTPALGNSSIAVSGGTADGGNIPVTITVRDGSNNPLPGYIPTFSVSGSGNTLGACSTSDANGLSTCAFSTTVAENKTFNVTGPSALIGLSTLVAFSPGAAAQLAILNLPSTTAAGAPFTTMTIDVRDANGNQVGTAANTVSVSAYSDPGCSVAGTGSLGGSLSVAASGGQANFSGVSYTLAGNVYLKFTSAGLTHACSTVVPVVAGAVDASTSSLVATPSSALADGVSAISLTATLRDAYNNPVPAQSVSFSVLSGPSVSFNQPASPTNSAGQTTGSAVASTSGARTLEIAGLAGVQASVNYVIGSPDIANSSISGVDGIVADGSATSTVTIIIRDSSNNPIPGIVPSFSATGTSNSYGACSTTDGSGTSTCTLSSTVAETKALNITFPSALSSVVSVSPVNFIAGPAVVLQVTGINSPYLAGFNSSVTVEARDGFGNRATSYSGTVQFTSDDGQAVLPADYTFVGGDAGVHTFTNAVSLRSVGYHYVNATDSVTGAIAGGIGSIQVDPGAAAQLSFFGAPPSNVNVGASFPTVMVQVLDAYGNNTNASVPVTLSAASNGDCLSSAPGTLFGGAGSASSGMASFSSVSYDTPGTIYLKASSSGLASACSSGILMNGPSTPDHLAFAVAPSSVTEANVEFPVQPVVHVQDASNNLVVSATNPIAITFSTDPGCAMNSMLPTLPVVNPVSASGGVASFSGIRARLQGPNFYVRASSPGLAPACAGPITFNGGTAHFLAFEADMGEQVGQCSNGSLYRVDGAFQPQSSGGSVSLNVTATGALQIFAGDNCGGGPVTSLTIPGGSDHAAFSVLNYTAENSVISVSDPLAFFPSITRTFTTVASGSDPVKAKINGPHDVTAGTCAGPFDITLRDHNWGNVNSIASHLFQLNTNGSTDFFSDNCVTPLSGNQLSFPPATASRQFWLRENAAPGRLVQFNAYDLNNHVAVESQGYVVPMAGPQATQLTVLDEFSDDHEFGINDCRTVVLVARDDAGIPVQLSSSRAINLSRTGSSMQFYPDMDCVSSPVTTLSFPAGASMLAVGVKNTAIEGVLVTFDDTSGSPVLGSANHWIEFVNHSGGGSGPSNPYAFDFDLQENFNVSDCKQFRVKNKSSMGWNDTPAPANQFVMVTVNGGDLFNDGACGGSPQSSIATTISIGNTESAVLSYRSSSPLDGIITVTRTSPSDGDYSSTPWSRYFLVGGGTGPIGALGRVGASGPSPQNTIYNTGCYPITVFPADSWGRALPSTGNSLSVQVSTSDSPSLGEIYLSPGCSGGGVQSTTISIPSGATPSQTVYYRAFNSDGYRHLNFSPQGTDPSVNGWGMSICSTDAGGNGSCVGGGGSSNPYYLQLQGGQTDFPASSCMALSVKSYAYSGGAPRTIPGAPMPVNVTVSGGSATFWSGTSCSGSSSSNINLSIGTGLSETPQFWIQTFAAPEDLHFYITTPDSDYGPMDFYSTVAGGTGSPGPVAILKLDVPTSITVDTDCVQVQLRSTDHWDRIVAIGGTSSNASITVSGSVPGGFYGDSACSGGPTSSASLSITPFSSSSAPMWYKATGGGSGNVEFNVSVTSGGLDGSATQRCVKDSGGGGCSGGGGPMNHYMLDGMPSGVATGFCQQFRIKRVDDNWNDLISSPDVTINLAVANSGAGQFYPDSSCTTGATGTTSVTIFNGNQYSSYLWFKSPASGENGQINMSSSDPAYQPNYSGYFVVGTGGGTQAAAKVNPMIIGGSLIATNCYEMQLRVEDNWGHMAGVPGGGGSLNLSLDSDNHGIFTYHTAPGCSGGLPSTNVSIPEFASNTSVWVKASAPGHVNIWVNGNFSWANGGTGADFTP